MFLGGLGGAGKSKHVYQWRSGGSLPAKGVFDSRIEANTSTKGGARLMTTKAETAPGIPPFDALESSKTEGFQREHLFKKAKRKRDQRFVTA